MKIVKSVAKNVRGSSRKLRIPAQVVKGMNVNEAIAVLAYMPKKAAKDVMKVIKTAQADAEHNFNLNKDELIVHSVRIDDSLKYKRFRPDSKGGAKPFVRKTSHITVELQSREEGKSKVAKETKKSEVKEEPKKSVKTKKKTK